MTQLITPEYLEIQSAYHLQRQDYGVSGHKWADHVRQFSDQLGSRDILDYGAGKESLQRALPFPIKMYDPAILHLSTAPEPADFVVCTDVLEHIEPECLDAVLDHLTSLTKRLLFIEVATRPAAKFLPDGRNAHLIQEPLAWWLPKLCARMDLQSCQNLGGSFVALATPYKPQATEAGTGTDNAGI